MQFTGKVALVTGASSGIGAAVAIALSSEGAKVVIVGRNKTKLANTAAKCTEPLAIHADVTRDDDARTIIQKTVQKFGKIDILVNNAGCYRSVSITDTNIMETYDFIMNVNLRAVFQITSLAVPYLIKTKGNIVNISSYSGHCTGLGSHAISYSVSKAGLSHFGACLAADLAPHGVRVNNICPGPVETDLMENCNISGTWDDFKATSPLGGVCKAEEISDLVLFVAHDKAKSITGSNYFCDNGLMIKRA